MEADANTQARLLIEAGQPQRALDMLSEEIGRLQFTRALTLLSLERWREGFAAYLHRPPRRNFARMNPRVKVLDSLTDFKPGDTALIGEQGIGDQLAFMRWHYPALNVPLYCDPKLVPILPRWMNAQPAGTPIKEGHAIMAGDLPYLLNVNGVPPPLIMTPDISYVERPAIGIAWQSGTPPSDQGGASVLAFKSVPLPMLLRITNSVHCTLVVIQRNLNPTTLKFIENESVNPVYDASNTHDDLANHMKQLRTLSGYVGVSSTTTHLLASLAKPAHIMVPWPADYRYPGNGARSPWFPTFTIHRQDAGGSWNDAEMEARDILTDNMEPRL